jgi:hypothetical protein
MRLVTLTGAFGADEQVGRKGEERGDEGGGREERGEEGGGRK